MQRYTLHAGDNAEALRQYPDNFFHAVVTDSPYGLGKEPDALEMLRDWLLTGHHDVKSKGGFMGRAWDAFIPQPALWREIYRVMRPGAHLLTFGGSRTYDLLALALRIAGFEIRDCIYWLYGSGFPKSRNIGKAMAAKEWSGWGTALKPAAEPIVLARKPIAESTIAANILKWYTGAINVDACRVPASQDEIKECTTIQPARPTVNAYGNHGEFMRHNGNGTSHSAGRWPANVIHDGSDEVEDGFPMTKSGGNIGKHPEMVNFHPGDSGSASRFFYCAKASKRDRDEGLEGFEVKEFHLSGGRKVKTSKGGDGIRENMPRRNHHPTVKPTTLMRYLCRLITPPGGVILDPFAGSGSTGKAAMWEGFYFVGMEREPEYVDIARARIEHAIKAAEEERLAEPLALPLAA